MVKEGQKAFDSLPLEEKHLNLIQKQLVLIQKVLGGEPTTMEEVGEIALTARGFSTGQRYLDKRTSQPDYFETALSIMREVKRFPKEDLLSDSSPLSQQIREMAKWAEPIAEERVEFYQERAKRLRGK